VNTPPSAWFDAVMAVVLWAGVVAGGCAALVWLLGD